MVFYTNNLANGTHTPYPNPTFEPTSSAIYINCLFFASLSISLVAAMASVIALQWVADYDAVISRGGSSPAERAKRRQFQFSGIEKWKMGEIIGSLPLLLYCSVGLFFLGLIVWMWDVQPIVAYVIIGGAALAALFYFSSTIIAVFFVSAPFRTPLSRWIYTIGRLSLPPLAWTSSHLGARLISKWMYSKYHAYTLVNKRVDRAVESDSSLSEDALIWLAGQVSISSDSHKRLLLLVSEIPVLSEAGLLTSKFTPRTWSTIFDLLGGHYLRSLNKHHHTSDHVLGMSVLTRCAKTPEIAQIIQPKLESHYNTNVALSYYWEQYCITLDGTVVNQDLTMVTPNALFLLTRDLPTPSPNSLAEIEAVLQLAKWRNSKRKPPEVWQHVFRRAEDYSSGFLDSCINLFRQYAVVSPWLFGDNNDQTVYVAIFNQLIHRATTRGMSSFALHSLTNAFESMVEAKKIRHVIDPTPCLYRPLLYGQKIQEMMPVVKEIHHSIVLLLARSLRKCPKDERTQRSYEVIAMLWLRPSSRTRRDWGQLIWTHDEDCEFAGLKAEVLNGWIHHIEEVPKIHEILAHLSYAQATGSNLGPLWRGSSKEMDKGRLVEALEVFDRLLRTECTSEEHLAIIEILCRDLNAIDLRGSGNPQEGHVWKQSVERIKDSCLRMIGCRTLEIDISEDHFPTGDYINTWQSSWSRTKEYIFDDLSHEVPASFWQLRALLWQSISQTRKSDICMGAWMSPEKLVRTLLPFRCYLLTMGQSQLMRIFDHAVTFTGNNDGTVFLLHHLHITRAGMVIFRDRNPHINGVPLKDRQLYPVLTLLVLSDIEDIRSLVLPDSINYECIMRVWEFCKSVKSQQFSLLSLVMDMAIYQAKHWTNYPEDLACLLYVVTESMGQGAEEASTSLLHPVAQSIRALRDAMMETGRGDAAERASVSAQATEVTYLLLSRLSTQVITGRSNLYSLSCARAVGRRAATEWLPMFE